MNLENVQAGDTLICSMSPGYRPTAVVVDRVTKTQIIVGTLRFRKCTGLLVIPRQYRAQIRLPFAGELKKLKLKQ